MTLHRSLTRFGSLHGSERSIGGGVARWASPIRMPPRGLADLWAGRDIRETLNHYQPWSITRPHRPLRGMHGETPKVVDCQAIDGIIKEIGGIAALEDIKQTVKEYLLK